MDKGIAEPRMPYVLYDARDMSIHWPPWDLARREVSAANCRLALQGRPEIWILRDSLTLYLLAGGHRLGRVN